MGAALPTSLPGNDRPSIAPRRHHPVAALLIGLLFAYLLTPILNAAHVEGFSAQIQSMALALAEGWTERHDLDLPLVSQFILTSRPGVIALLAGLNILTGGSSDANFHLLVAASLLVLIAASCVFARRWGGASYPFALLTLILVPGAFVLGFYFADNVVSTAFVVLAMAAIGPRSRLPAFTVAGALMAAAVLCRIDAVLALPLAALLAPMQRATVRHVALAALAFLAGFVPVTAVAAWAFGFTFLDSVAVARLFEPPDRFLAGPIQGLYFFGLIAPPLLAIGAWTELRPLRAWRDYLVADLRRAWRLALLILYPLALLAYAALEASEMRYLFPFLLPLIALHGAEGIERILRVLKTRGPGFRPALLFAPGAAAVFFAPPLLVQVRDGPSSLTGYAWSPILWHRWQRLQDESFARVDAVVRDVTTRPRTTLVSTGWNDEFYMRFRLMEAGYRSVDTAAAFPGCAGFATYRRGASEILHLRLWPQYWLSPFQSPEHAALFLTAANACPPVRSTRDIWVVAFAPNAARHLRDHGFRSLSFASALEVPVAHDPLGERIRILSHGEWPGAVAMPAFAARRMNQAELAMMAMHARFLLEQGRPMSAALIAERLRADARVYQATPIGRRRWTAPAQP